MKKFRVQYLSRGKVVDAGECELMEYKDERLKLKNGRLFYLPVRALAEVSRKELKKLLEVKNGFRS